MHAIDKHINLTGSIDNVTAKGSKGYGSAFFKWGDQTYYQDLNIQVERKISKAFKLNLMYMNQFYNKNSGRRRRRNDTFRHFCCRW